MTKNVIIFLIVLLVFIGGVVFYNYQHLSDNTDNKEDIINNESGPHIAIEPATHDFGRVKYGDVPEYTFIVKNIGDQILEINGVTTSCACTKGEIDNMNIEPGGQANLLVSFDPAVHGDDTDIGELTRTIYISTNESHEEEAEAKIYADVYRE
ncbi:MAG: DUF1573 domain-containing protein [bacterium]|nr:DUF1573 domain-containing protein [bacterium]